MKNVLRKIGIFISILGGLLVLAVLGIYLNSALQLNRTYEFADESIVIPADEQSIAEGKRWVTATCAGCHGADLAGRAMINDPAIGLVYSANLTSGTGGIGTDYTDADWVRALRHGVDQDGKPLLIMPSSAFWSFSDEDLGEVIAYLKIIPPVDNETTVKLSLLGTILLPNDPTTLHVKLIDHNNRPAETVVGVNAEYGEYLVNVSGCRECHGGDLTGKPSMNGRLAAPNITPDGTIQAWSVEDFINTIRTGITPQNRPLSSHDMPWQEYSNYTDDELTAIHLYLQSLSEE